MTMLEIMATPLSDKPNMERQTRILSLAWSIPFEKKKTTIPIVIKLLEHVLSIDYLDRYWFQHSQTGEKALESVKNKIREGSLNITGREQPFEKFLIKALATSKSWQMLVKENNINKFFQHHEYMGQPRQFLIAYICWRHYPIRVARILIYNLLQRTSDSSHLMLIQIKKNPYYAKKVQQLKAKSSQELQKIEDQQLKKLLQSVRMRHSLVKTVKNQPLFSNLERDSYNQWLYFLYWEASRYTQVIKISAGRKLSSKIQKRCQIIKPELMTIFKQRLKRVLLEYDTFEEYFVDEVEIMLLYGIRQNTPWKVLKKQINTLPWSSTQVEVSLKSQQLDKSIEEGEESKHISADKANDIQEIKEETSLLQSSDILNEELQMKEKEKSNYPNALATRMSSLSQEQKIILLLLQRSQTYLEKIKIECLQMTSSAVDAYLQDKGNEIAPLAENQLNFYRQCPYDCFSIQNPQMKFLITSNLAAEKIFNTHTKIIEDQEHISSNAHELEDNKEDEWFWTQDINYF